MHVYIYLKHPKNLQLQEFQLTSSTYNIPDICRCYNNFRWLGDQLYLQHSPNICRCYNNSRWLLQLASILWSFCDPNWKEYRCLHLFTTPQKFAGAIAIPGGYYSCLLSFRLFVILTGIITGADIYLQHSKSLQVL